MAGMAKTKSFRDHMGNRLIFPSMIIYADDENSRSASDVVSQAIMLSMRLDLKLDKEWFEFDPKAFPHVKTIAGSRAFAHGGATVLLFEGPEFDAISKAESA